MAAPLSTMKFWKPGKYEKKEYIWHLVQVFWGICVNKHTTGDAVQSVSLCFHPRLQQLRDICGQLSSDNVSSAETKYNVLK